MSDVKVYPPVQVSTCDASRIRRGVEERCNDEAVALALAGDMLYPVCAFHTRTMTAVTLEQTLRHGWLTA